MAVINISGTIHASFSTSGILINIGQTGTDAVFIIDLRPENPRIIVKDGLDHAALGWNINDVVAVVTLTGPEGEIYDNDDFTSPDIVPATSRDINKVITLPLDPLTDYKNILKGNYTLKIVWYNSVLDEYYNFLETYRYDRDLPTIANKTVSGPYTGILKSTDTSEYGSDIFTIVREHRIEYPDELVPQPADVVSSNAEVQVTPIYTNEWNVIINTFVEYRQPDTLRIYWEGTGEFTHCVYGGCIGAMYEAIDTMLDTYTEELACNLVSKEQYQHRLVTLNTAWHLLNEAYWSGDAEGADEQAYIIQEQVAYTGSGTCGGSTSEEVIPCPAWTGGGTGGTYTFDNGLTEGGGVVVLGGSLKQATAILTGAYEYRVAGSSGSNNVSFIEDAVAGSVVAKANDSSYEGEIAVGAGAVTLKYKDIITPANNKGYTVGSGGLVEDADYSAGYTPLSLVNKSYVDGILTGLESVVTDATLSGDGTSLSPLAVAVPFPGFTDLNTDYGYIEPTHTFAEITDKPTTLAGYGITDAPTTFVQMTDTPASYTGFGGYFVRVKSTGDGLEFVTGTWVPAGGGEFTGPVTISTSINRPLVLHQIGAGTTPGTPEGGINYISFQDNDGDEQGYIGIDGSGNVVLHTSVTGGKILAGSSLTVNGNVTVSGSLTVDVINEALTNSGVSIDGVVLKDGNIAHTYLPYTFKNGITYNADDVKLGGTLTEATVITGSNTSTFLVRGASTVNSLHVGTYQDNVIDLKVWQYVDYTGDQTQVSLSEGVITIAAHSGVNKVSLGFSTTQVLFTDSINSKGVEYAADYSANWTDHSLVTKKWVTDTFLVSGGSVIVQFSTKATGTDAGTQGELSIDDDYMYICVTGGGAGVAIWKKIALSQT